MNNPKTRAVPLHGLTMVGDRPSATPRQINAAFAAAPGLVGARYRAPAPALTDNYDNTPDFALATTVPAPGFR